MATFAGFRLDGLPTHLALRGGVPSHDNFRQVFGLPDRKQFAASSFQWPHALYEAPGGHRLAIDGKAPRHSFTKKSGLKAPHFVAAWARGNGLKLGQLACAEKSIEITAIPKSPKLLNRKKCAVIVDAMNCHSETVQEIREQVANYVPAVKNHQPTIPGEMQVPFEDRLNRDFVDMECQTCSTTEQAEGRSTERTYHAIELPADHPLRQKWRDL